MSREVHVRFCESREVRFLPATHLVVLVRGERRHVEALREQITHVLQPIGLVLPPTKTQIVHMSEGFDFLGFHIRWRPKRGTTKWFVSIPSSRNGRSGRCGTRSVFGERPGETDREQSRHAPQVDSTQSGMLTAAFGYAASTAR